MFAGKMLSSITHCVRAGYVGQSGAKFQSDISPRCCVELNIDLGIGKQLGDDKSHL